MDTFSHNEIEQIAKILGDAATASELRKFLDSAQISFISQESTKWRFLNDCFVADQKTYMCWNHILGFIKLVLDPIRFIEDIVNFEELRHRLNQVLSFKGLKYTKDKEFKRTRAVDSLNDLPKIWRTRLIERGVHCEVLKYCTQELLQEDVCHAVFEAAKGLLERIREKAHVEDDGSKLIDAVFSGERPILALNTLMTQTERSEQTGFAQILKGICSVIRNPIAHEPRSLWDGEEYALEFFSLLSLAHKILDKCVLTGYKK